MPKAKKKLTPKSVRTPVAKTLKAKASATTKKKAIKKVVKKMPVAKKPLVTPKAQPKIEVSLAQSIISKINDYEAKHSPKSTKKYPVKFVKVYR